MKKFTKETMFGFFVGIMSVAITIVTSPLAIMAIEKYSIVAFDFQYSNYVAYGIVFLGAIGLAIDVTDFIFSMFIKSEDIELKNDTGLVERNREMGAKGIASDKAISIRPYIKK